MRPDPSSMPKSSDRSHEPALDALASDPLRHAAEAPVEGAEGGGGGRGAGDARPWLGIRFRCAGAYVRVYRSSRARVYLAACPRCARTIRFRVGEGGTPERFFDVDCGVIHSPR